MPAAGAPAGATTRRHIFDGTAWGFIAEALAVPTGIATVAFLTRALGASGYGLFGLTIALVMWLEGGLASLLSRATIKFVSQSEDWRPIGRTVLRLNLGVGIGVALLLIALAGPIARALHEPALVPYLRVFALDLPAAALSQAHEQLLVGLGRYRPRAAARAARWIVRLSLIVALVAAGLGIIGALAGSIGATVAELLVARRRIKPSLFGGPAAAARPLLTFATPLFMAGMATALLKKVDLFALKSLGGTVAQAGLYAAAQNVALMPSLFSLAFAPLLLSSMNRAMHEGRPDAARRLGADFLRVALWLLPFAAMAAGAAGDIARFLYGPGFDDAGPPLAWLMFAGVALALAAVASGILIAADHPRWTVAVAGVPLLVVSGAFAVLIPRYGPAGAAAATTIGSATGALVGLAAVHRLWRLLPSWRTALRAGAVAGAAYAAAAFWPASGWLVVPKLALIALAIPLLFVAAGEFTWSELTAMRNEVTGQRAIAAMAPEEP